MKFNAYGNNLMLAADELDQQESVVSTVTEIMREGALEIDRLATEHQAYKAKVDKLVETSFELAHYCDSIVSTLLEHGYSSRSEGLKKRMLAVSTLTTEGAGLRGEGESNDE